MPTNLMKQLITVQRPTVSQDASLGQVPTYSNAYSNVRASVQPASGSVLFMYAQRNIKVTHSIFTETQVAIRVGDRLYDGTNTYQVTGVANLISLGAVYRIDCELYMG